MLHPADLVRELSPGASPGRSGELEQVVVQQVTGGNWSRLAGVQADLFSV